MDLTDAQTPYLDGLVRLEWLEISDTDVTLTGLELLKGLPRLNYILLGPFDHKKARPLCNRYGWTIGDCPCGCGDISPDWETKLWKD